MIRGRKLIIITFMFALYSVNIIACPPKADHRCIRNKVCSQTSPVVNSTSFEKWISKNSGTLVGSILGAFLAGLVAIGSIRLTHKRNLILKQIDHDSARAEADNIYCGTLYAMYHEIAWHINLTERLQQEMKMMAGHASTQGDLLQDYSRETYRIDSLTSFRINILEYPRYDSELLALLTTYMNYLLLINKHLDYRELSKYQDRYADGAKFAEALKKYFVDVLEMLDKVQVKAPELHTMIVDILKRFPQNTLIDELTD